MKDEHTKKEQKSGAGWLMRQYPWLVLGLVFLGLVFLNARYLEHWLDSDMAAEMMFSRLLAREGHLFGSANWYYSTEFRVLYTQLLMVPLFHLTGNWHLIRCITNVVFYLLVLGSYFYLMKPLHCERKKTILAAAVLILPFSETLMLHMEMGNTYLSHVILIFFCFGLFLRLQDPAAGKVLQVLRWCLFLLLSVIFGLSGVRYLFALEAPLVLACLLTAVRDEQFQRMRREPDAAQLRNFLHGRAFRNFVFACIGLLMTLAGYAGNVVFISHRYSFQTYGSTQFIDVYQGILTDRLQDTFGSLLMLFGYIPQKSVLSVRGLVTMAAFLMLFLLGYAAVRCRSYQNQQLRDQQSRDPYLQGQQFRPDGSCIESRTLLVTFFFTAFWLNTFVFVFTNSTIVPRYYITSVIFLVPVTVLYLTLEQKILDRRIFAFLLICCLGLATLKTTASMVTTDKNADRYGAITFLEQEHYHFGYATYWNGNITQELSNGQLELANLRELDAPVYFRWSSEAAYYSADAAQGKVFLLLTQEEAKTYHSAALLQAGKKVYDDGAFVVYTYDSNEEVRNYVEK